jgi:peptide-methionine (R)-S-oxide reductase
MIDQLHRLCLAAGLLLLAGCQPDSSANAMNPAVPPDPPSTSAPPTTATSPARVELTEAEWRARLTPEQYQVLRQAGTERAFGAAYEEFKKQGDGTYVCAGCGAELFRSKEKFDSHCGWPSFYDPANATNVVNIEDRSHGMLRVEVRCRRCNGHLGHVFKGEGFNTPVDQRYCINGVSLKFVPDTNQPSVKATPPKK